MLLHTNSQMYFRDLLIAMIYKTIAYHFRSCIAAREQCQLYYNHVLIPWSASSVLAKKMSQLSGGIEIINSMGAISALSSKCAYST